MMMIIIIYYYRLALSGRLKSLITLSSAVPLSPLLLPPSQSPCAVCIQEWALYGGSGTAAFYKRQWPSLYQMVYNRCVLYR